MFVGEIISIVGLGFSCFICVAVCSGIIYNTRVVPTAYKKASRAGYRQFVINRSNSTPAFCLMCDWINSNVNTQDCNSTIVSISDGLKMCNYRVPLPSYCVRTKSRALTDTVYVEVEGTDTTVTGFTVMTKKKSDMDAFLGELNIS